jgi:exopolysaccharide biosynthesis polyprenyl glycosylphosphotransferase
MKKIQQHISLFKFIDLLLDALLLLLSIIIATLIENFIHNNNFFQINFDNFKVIGFPIIIIIFLLFIKRIERNKLYRFITYYEILFNIVKIIFLSSSSLLFINFLFKINLFYRSTFIFFILVIFVLLIMKRILIKKYLSYIRFNGKDLKNILIYGNNEKTLKLIEYFNNHLEFGLKIKYIISPDNSSYVSHDKIKILEEGKLKIVILKESIDEVFFTIPTNKIINYENIIEFLQLVGVNYHFLIDINIPSDKNQTFNLIPNYSNYFNLPMVSFSLINANPYQIFIKLIVEKFITILLLAVLFPIILICGIFIKFSSKGPIIFKQKRVGLRGRLFTQYKLRTMVINADKIKESLNHLNEQSGPIFKIENDPRINRFGKFYRKFSLDELPQLFNVLKGDMNLIGPRPPIPEEVLQYKTNQYRRLSMKPGITGLWQVSGRNAIKNFEDWVRIDLEYIDNWSLILDFKIAVKTILVVLSGSGK